MPTATKTATASLLTVDRKRFLAALARVNRVVPTRTSKPIRRGVHLNAADGELQLRAWAMCGGQHSSRASAWRPGNHCGAATSASSGRSLESITMKLPPRSFEHQTPASFCAFGAVQDTSASAEGPRKPPSSQIAIPARTTTVPRVVAGARRGLVHCSRRS